MYTELCQAIDWPCLLRPAAVRTRATAALTIIASIVILSSRKKTCTPESSTITATPVTFIYPMHRHGRKKEDEGEDEGEEKEEE